MPNIPLKYTSKETQVGIFNKARKRGFLDDDDAAVIFVDYEILKNRLAHIQASYPKSIQHTAIKTNPLSEVLSIICQGNLGLEAASYEEVLHGLRFTENIIFDSPAKTSREIKLLESLPNKIIINANSLHELNLLKNSKHNIGLRINPLLDTDSPAALTVSNPNSKFGIPLTNRKEILDAFSTISNLTGLHIHIGSQVGKSEAYVQAITAIYKLAKEIDRIRSSAGQSQLTYIDIGGGIPADYSQNDVQGMSLVSEAVHKAIPTLFDEYQVYTEFGRFVHANTAWVVSEVQDILEHTNPQTVIVHVGGDMFLRDVYSEVKINHKIHPLNLDTSNNLVNYQIGGPLCFGGDFVNKNISLPQLKIGDYIVIDDVGANTFSLWSMHCTRSFPKVIGYENDELYLIKDRVAPSEMIKFWDK